MLVSYVLNKLCRQCSPVLLDVQGVIQQLSTVTWYACVLKHLNELCHDIAVMCVALYY